MNYDLYVTKRAMNWHPWKGLKGKQRILVRTIEQMRDMQEEREKILTEAARKEGIALAKALQIEGYTIETIGEEWRLLKDEEIIIDKTLNGPIVVQLPEWLKMKVPVKVRLSIRETGKPKIYSLSVTKRDGKELNLFHTNTTDTCWGQSRTRANEILDKGLTKEGADALVKLFKETMEIANYHSMFSVDEELIDTKLYIKRKYLEEKQDEELEDIKERILEKNTYLINKQTVQEVTTQ